MANRCTVFPNCLMVFINLKDNFLRKVQIEVVSPIVVQHGDKETHHIPLKKNVRN